MSDPIVDPAGEVIVGTVLSSTTEPVPDLEFPEPCLVCGLSRNLNEAGACAACAALTPEQLEALAAE